MDHINNNSQAGALRRLLFRTRLVLRLGGWYPGYAFDLATYQAAIQNMGFSFVAPAQWFLSHFGGISVGVNCSAVIRLVTELVSQTTFVLAEPDELLMDCLRDPALSIHEYQGLTDCVLTPVGLCRGGFWYLF